MSLVVFIEIFAFFFLRLYRSSLDEVKYFQNELTNVEMRLVALEAALVLGHSGALDTTINQLARTERNSILKKGESTVDLEKLRAENQYTVHLLDRVSKAIPSFRPSSKA
jgi:hypothetical protein